MDQTKLAAEVATFLRNLHGLNKSIALQLSPILEERLGIGMRLYFILRIIDGGTVHPSAIAQAIHLPNSLVTKHLDQLAEKTLLARSLDPGDSRRIRVTLTLEGTRVIREADAIFSSVVGKRLARIPDDRRGVFLETLVALANDSDRT